MTDSLSKDAFLGGKLHLWQPKSGYRAGVDPVLLAASVPARAGDSVLDLGCGVGAAGLCLRARVPGIALTGVELQPDYAALARRNGGDDFQVFTCDITDLPADLRQRQFDHVIANPPYFDQNARRPARDLGRETALGETVPLAVWVKTAAKRLVPRGYAHFIQRVERLPDLLCALPHDMGSIQVLPLSPRPNRRPELVILRARKSGKGDFKLHVPLILHRGDSHEKDGDSYVAQIKAVLRDGAALEF